ncbi:MAG: hypothetical protein EBE86_019110 [Hormoscilla sp. GUM202]|nr:hypothetical protein [Hormoscilla sp. GUM202]
MAVGSGTVLRLPFGYTGILFKLNCCRPIARPIAPSPIAFPLTAPVGAGPQNIEALEPQLHELLFFAPKSVFLLGITFALLVL